MDRWKPDLCVAMNDLLLITIVSIISTGRRVGPPLLIFVMLLWRAPGRRCAMRFLSPWRSWVVISPPWSRRVWSALKEKHWQNLKNKKWKLPQIKVPQLLQEAVCQPSIPWPRTAPIARRAGTGPRPPYMEDERLSVLCNSTKENCRLQFFTRKLL